MTRPDDNPYESPRGGAVRGELQGSAQRLRRTANAAFVIALAGAPLAWACGVAQVDVGHWDDLSRIMPATLVLYLYAATGWATIAFAFGGVAAVAVAAICGNWWQRIVLIFVPLPYVPLLMWLGPYVWGKLFGTN